MKRGNGDFSYSGDDRSTGRQQQRRSYSLGQPQPQDTTVSITTSTADEAAFQPPPFRRSLVPGAHSFPPPPAFAAAPNPQHPPDASIAQAALQQPPRLSPPTSVVPLHHSRPAPQRQRRGSAPPTTVPTAAPAEDAETYNRWLQDKAAEYLHMQSTFQLQELRKRLVSGALELHHQQQQQQQLPQSSATVDSGTNNVLPISPTTHRSIPISKAPTSRAPTSVSPVSKKKSPLVAPCLGLLAPTRSPHGAIEQINKTNEAESPQRTKHIKKNTTSAKSETKSPPAGRTSQPKAPPFEVVPVVEQKQINKSASLVSQTTVARGQDNTGIATRLARQLMGREPIQDDAPAIELDPELVQDIARNIRVSVNELAEAAIRQTRIHAQAKLEHDIETDLAVARRLADERNAEYQQREVTQQQLVAKLRVDLEVLQRLGEEQGNSSDQHHVDDTCNNDDDNNNNNNNNRFQEQQSSNTKNATVTNLWKQLEGGLAKIQAQDRDVVVLREKIRVSALEKDRSNKLVAELGTWLEQLQRSNNLDNDDDDDDHDDENHNRAAAEVNYHIRPASSTPISTSANYPSATQQQQEEDEVTRLERQKKELEDMIKEEKHYSELSIQSYMEASIFQLQKSREHKESASTNTAEET